MNFIKIIKIDIDFYTEKESTKKRYLDNIRKKSEPFGDIILDKKTKHGHHFKIKLHKKVSFWRSIEIRYYLQDDIKRMFYDIMRRRSGAKMYDVLFDIKRKTRK